MKFLARIEKQKIAWIIILFCVIFTFLRLPSLIEPYWYGDEAIYEVVGQGMNHGHLLYRDIWDNKPPLLYVIYAFANGDQFMVKAFSLLIGLFTLVAFYFLAQKLFYNQKISLSLMALFLFLFATPFLEANIANAENFILLPVILAGLIIFRYFGNAKPTSLNPKTLFLAGILLGVAFLLKIVVIFDLAAFLGFIIFVSLPEKPSPSLLKNLKIDREVGQTLVIILLGFLVPFFITILYFAGNFAVKDFFQATFFGNVDYVGWKNNLFGIPQGWLILKILLLAGGLGLILLNRKRFSKAEIFILLWLLFSIFNVYFSGRPYTHYALILIPSFCLFVGLLFIPHSQIAKLKIGAALLILIILLYYQFMFSLQGSLLYYQNVIQFLNGQKNIESYQSSFDPKVPRDYSIANFITTHTNPSDTVFVWGNNPEIYVLSHKNPIEKYAVAYHISQNNAFDETQQALNRNKPKYIIVLSESQPLPFVIPLYIMRYQIAGATIYERSL